MKGTTRLIVPDLARGMALLGIGFGMVAASLARKGYGPAESRRVLLRRYAWLGAFGPAHMFLIFYNEIMFAYGLVGVGLAVVYRMASKSLLRIAYVILGGFAAFCASGALGAYYGYYDPHSIRSQLSTDLTTERLHNRVPVWARAFVALGRRSMSGYIAQSFIFRVKGQKVCPESPIFSG